MWYAFKEIIFITLIASQNNQNKLGLDLLLEFLEHKLHKPEGPYTVSDIFISSLDLDL